MKIEVGQKLEVLNPEVIEGYYDAVYVVGDVLTVQSEKVCKVRQRKGTSAYFAIIGNSDKKTKRGDQYRFSVSLDDINTKNFKRVV